MRHVKNSIMKQLRATALTAIGVIGFSSLFGQNSCFYNSNENSDPRISVSFTNKRLLNPATFTQSTLMLGFDVEKNIVTSVPNLPIFVFGGARIPFSENRIGIERDGRQVSGDLGNLMFDSYLGGGARLDMTTSEENSFGFELRTGVIGVATAGKTDQTFKVIPMAEVGIGGYFNRISIRAAVGQQFNAVSFNSTPPAPPSTTRLPSSAFAQLTVGFRL